MVGLDPGELEEQGFMDGFASVLSNLQNPSDINTDSDASKDQQRRAKIRMLREQARYPAFVPACSLCSSIRPMSTFLVSTISSSISDWQQQPCWLHGTTLLVLVASRQMLHIKPLHMSCGFTCA